MLKHSQNSKFVMSSKYLKKEVREKVDKHWVLRVLRVTNLQYIYNISKKKLP